MNTNRTALTIGTLAAIGFSGTALACDPADFDLSGHVGLEDLAGYLTAYLAGDKSADTNADGRVMVQDLFDFVGNWIARYIEESQASTPIGKSIKIPLDDTMPRADSRSVWAVGVGPQTDTNP